MKLVLLVMQMRLLSVEADSDKALEKNLTGNTFHDQAVFFEVVGTSANRGWQEGVHAGQVASGKKVKPLPMGQAIKASIEKRITNAFAEASGVFQLRTAANRDSRIMRDKIYSEYIRKLKGSSRAAMHDAANAGYNLGAK